MGRVSISRPAKARCKTASRGLTDTAEKNRAMNVEIRDPRFTSVVGAEVQFDKIATGFRFTEGPLWHPKADYLLFSDIPGDQLHRWSTTGGVSSFRKPSNMSN